MTRLFCLGEELRVGVAEHGRCRAESRREGDRQQLSRASTNWEHLQSPVSGLTAGETVRSKYFVNMLGGGGSPRVFDRTILHRKLGKIAKGKAPGYSGNGPGVYAAMPGGWVDWAVKLANIIQFTQITPAGWHIALVHYVHKGGSDGSLSNHRPLALVEVFRKVITSIIYDRIKRDFKRLNSRSHKPGVPGGTHDNQLDLPAPCGS